MATIAFTILPLIPIGLWGLLVGWSPSDTEGDVILHLPVPVLSRLKMLAVPFTIGLLLAIAGMIAGTTWWGIIIVLLAIYGAILAIPVHYTLTSIGIRVGRGAFRRWTEFAGVRRSASGATLQGGPRTSSYPVFLSGSREDDEFVLTLRNLVRDAYKGKATQVDRLRRGTAG